MEPAAETEVWLEVVARAIDDAVLNGIPMETLPAHLGAFPFGGVPKPTDKRPLALIPCA